jgi:hypothetical protein
MKRLSLIVGIVLVTLFSGSVVNAQNTAGTPYAGSTHIYTVDVENPTNTLPWEICTGSTWSDAAKLTEGASDDYVLTNDISDNDNSKASITWGTSLTAGQYTIRFMEENGSNCLSIRTAVITLSANAFDLALTGEGDDCADPSVNNLVTTQADPGSTVRTFTVTNTDGNMTNWTYTLNYTVVGNGGNDAAFTIDVDGSSVTSGSSVSVSGSSTSTITFTIDNDNVLLAEQTVTVTIGNNNTGLVETDPGNNNDNTLVYKLPNTGDITF